MRARLVLPHATVKVKCDEFLGLKQELLHGLEPRVAWYNTVYSCITSA